MEYPTVAAVSTPHGIGAVGIVRLSGSNCLDVLKKVFSPYKRGFSEFTPNYMYYGRLHDADGELIDICMAAFFKAPASYTGEDSAELYCHGGAAVLSAALDAVFKAGAVPAAAGEFTKRAFLNGKLDLYEAEAVIDIISAQSQAEAKNAVRQLENKGDFGIAPLRRRLVELLSSFYAEVDFPDEGVPQLISSDAVREMNSIADRLKILAESYTSGKFLKDGVPVAIVGRPNVGKSSLMNALCGSERAIVTDIEGTTRDVIDDCFCYRGMTFRLFDTAGIRETSDTVEKIGVDRAVKTANQAFAVIALTDCENGFADGELSRLGIACRENVVFAANKCDTFTHCPPENYIEISAKNHIGLENIKQKLYNMCGGQNIDRLDTVITNARQAEAVNSALARLLSAVSAAEAGVPLDIVLSDVEDAATFLGHITGETLPDDVINDIFSRFCVGK